MAANQPKGLEKLHQNLSTMEVILLKNIEKVGRKFDIVKVKDGFGRNYLIPQGLALIANDRNRNNLDSFKRQEARKLEQRIDEFRAIAAKVNGQSVNVIVKAGISGKIFGSVTNVQLAKIMKEQIDIEIDRHSILLPNEVKMLGSYEGSLDLHPEVEAVFKFVVMTEDGRTGPEGEEETTTPATAEAAETPAKEETEEAAAATTEEEHE